MKVIVGLGNPGPKYKFTRHNAGFMAIDELAKKYGLAWRDIKKLNATIANSPDVLLVKPMIFMNESGQAVQAVLSYYKLLSAKIATAGSFDLSDSLTVIHDDLDIGLSRYKISSDSRSAGHNGVQSIIDHLGTKNFKRVRIGIGPADTNIIPAEKFVLQPFNKEEITIISGVINDLLGKI